VRPNPGSSIRLGHKEGAPVSELASESLLQRLRAALPERSEGMQ